MSNVNNDITTPILTNSEQYRHELLAYPALSKAEQFELEEMARAGDGEARERLLIDCARFVAFHAAGLACVYLQYDKDYLDVVQVGNLALVEHIDETLQTGKPVSYLCGIARKQMRYYALYRSLIIDLPMNKAVPREKLVVVSLDALQVNQEWIEIESKLTRLNEESDQPNAFSALYGPLQQAIAALTDEQREMVTRHYGLAGAPTEQLVDISKQLKISSNVGYVRYYRALKKLQQYLKKQA